MTHNDEKEFSLRKEQIEKLFETSKLFVVGSRTCGVYILYRQNEVVYVGKSQDVHNRITQHKDKTFDSYRVIECQLFQIETLERCLINWFDPEYNIDSFTVRMRDQKEENNCSHYAPIHSVLNYTGSDTTDNPFRKFFEKKAEGGQQ